MDTDEDNPGNYRCCMNGEAMSMPRAVDVTPLDYTRKTHRRRLRVPAMYAAMVVIMVAASVGWTLSYNRHYWHEFSSVRGDQNRITIRFLQISSRDGELGLEFRSYAASPTNMRNVPKSAGPYFTRHWHSNRDEDAPRFGECRSIDDQLTGEHIWWVTARIPYYFIVVMTCVVLVARALIAARGRRE